MSLVQVFVVVSALLLAMLLGALLATHDRDQAPRVRCRPTFDPARDLIVPFELALNVGLIRREADRFLQSKDRRPERVVIDVACLDGLEVFILDGRGLR